MALCCRCSAAVTAAVVEFYVQTSNAHAEALLIRPPSLRCPD